MKKKAMTHASSFRPIMDVTFNSSMESQIEHKDLSLVYVPRQLDGNMSASIYIYI